jgi:hypothetical protein
MVGAMAVAAGFVLFSKPHWQQNLAYHDFADQRTLLGVPHFWNVVSNLPFLIVGLLGLRFILRDRESQVGKAFICSTERWPYLMLFLGVAFTAFGSAYYHLEPSNQRLVWDRLPMAVAFMALFSGVIAERMGIRIGLGLLGPLVTAGVGSVLYWACCDDLRPYYLVQFFPILAMPWLVLLFPPRYTGTSYLFAALGYYVLAKFCEHPGDAPIYEALGGAMSGHTFKHLLACLGAYQILRMLQRRQPTVREFARSGFRSS